MKEKRENVSGVKLEKIAFKFYKKDSNIEKFFSIIKNQFIEKYREHYHIKIVRQIIDLSSIQKSDKYLLDITF